MYYRVAVLLHQAMMAVLWLNFLILVVAYPARIFAQSDTPTPTDTATPTPTDTVTPTPTDTVTPTPTGTATPPYLYTLLPGYGRDATAPAMLGGVFIASWLVSFFFGMITRHRDKAFRAMVLGFVCVCVVGLLGPASGIPLLVFGALLVSVFSVLDSIV